MISLYSPEKELPVYEGEVWWGDDWDPTEFGRDVSFAEPFFAQWQALHRVVPRLGLIGFSNENSEYVNHSGWDKNCYLCFCVDHSEDCLHCSSVYYSKNVADSLYCRTAERCYECVDCNECNNVLFSHNAQNCSDSAWLDDCVACRNCVCCAGLRHREFCWGNEQLSKEEFQRRYQALFPMTPDTIRTMRQQTEELSLSRFKQHAVGVGNEESSGDYLFHSKHAEACFDSADLESSKFCTNMRGAKDCVHVNYWGHPGELCYEGFGVGEGSQRVLFCGACWDATSDILYCDTCIHCRDCFGCIGLRHKRYCILNKQYSKEEYEALVPRLIAHMRQSGEWGEYFPPALSIFAYNETVAQEYFPLTKEEVLERGWKWREETDEMPKVSKVIPAAKLPSSIDDVPDDILNWAIECEATKRPFKIIKQELEFYRMMGLPIPHFHPDERHRRRMAQRNPRKLWKRNCAKCGNSIMTSYAPERPEKVVCEACYLKEVY